MHFSAILQYYINCENCELFWRNAIAPDSEVYVRSPKFIVENVFPSQVKNMLVSNFKIAESCWSQFKWSMENNVKVSIFSH